MKEKKKFSLISFLIWFFIIIYGVPMLIGLLSGGYNDNDDDDDTAYNYDSSKFNLISSSENEILDDEIKKFADKNDIDLKITYADTLDMMSKLNSGEKYDAIWSANSLWVYRTNVSLSESKSMSINPVIFGIKKSKAESLGFVGKDVRTKDILEAISNKKLKFSMSNPNSTNSGAVAYLGILSTLAGNPDVLTLDMLNSSKLKNDMKTFFTGLERTSGDEDYLEELFLNGDFEAVVSYESSIININKKLVKEGKEPLYAIYPVDGVSISDSVLAYIDNKNDKKKEEFLKLQDYFLSNDGQKVLESVGRRTWYGGTTDKAPRDIFNPDWGIDTTKYISPIRYPSDEVINRALLMYQEELRKPIHVVFCLDYSGSMRGEGYEELINAMDYILSDSAKNDNIQFTSKDKIDILPFASDVKEKWSTNDGSNTSKLLENVKSHSPGGSTALYSATIEALKILRDGDSKYNVSVILMTDGEANESKNTYTSLRNYYTSNRLSIPVFSITFGSADEYELNNIAELTNGKVFDGKKDLVEAFREVREYN
ncbi:MAG: VWA domain-containing protein [Bacilli bacterium]|nr:VWA domain-containing protein [Bacilli bacterium]